MQKILVFGANSAIAKAVARAWAAKGKTLYLAARNSKKLDTLAQDLRTRGAKTVFTAIFEAENFSSHEKIIAQASEVLGGIDLVLIAHGSLPNQSECQQDFELTLKELNTNAISVISLLTKLANQFEAQRKGVIVVISSVAGDRGRQSNYVYGSAKSMVSVFLQGLRNRLAPKGVQVLDIKPGFVNTPMTSSFKKGLLWSEPDKIAKLIIEAIENKKNEAYVPPYWRLIMFFIKLIPENLFKKLKL